MGAGSDRRTKKHATKSRSAKVRPAGRRPPGRPPVHAEPWTKVTVVLLNRQIAFLDRLAANIGDHGGGPISRAQLIRALVDSLSEADIDLTASRSEKDLQATLVARLGKYRL